MPVSKCQNPQCDFFQKPVPEGDFCPFCGEPIGQLNLTPLTPITSPVNTSRESNSFSSGHSPSPSQEFSSPSNPPSVPKNSSRRHNSSATFIEPLKPTLKITHNSGKQFVILGGRSYIGRQGGDKVPNPEIDISDIPYAERTSRPHACIYWDEPSQKYMITDEKSTNGTILNGQPLQPNTPYVLNHGAELELGREHLVKFHLSIT